MSYLKGSESGAQVHGFILHMPRWCKGSHEGLKIPWTFVRAGSSPALGTNVDLVIFQHIYINNLGMTGIDWWISSLI